jgi:hypothetical protein
MRVHLFGRLGTVPTLDFDRTGEESAFRPQLRWGDMTELERRNAEQQAAIILAGKRIGKLNSGRREDPVLVIWRRTLRESRRARSQNAL